MVLQIRGIDMKACEPHNILFLHIYNTTSIKGTCSSKNILSEAMHHVESNDSQFGSEGVDCSHRVKETIFSLTSY